MPNDITHDSNEPHCAEHIRYLESCPVCKQALANIQPYPVRKTAAPSRSFGMTGDITEATLRGPAYTSTYTGLDPESAVEFSLSLTVIRFILRLIWPFSRII